MGYSAKYHALSLMAVFVAIAFGILIGAGFGDSLVEGGADQLQESLSHDLDEANARLEASNDALEAEREYSEDTYPALVEGRLRDQQLSVVALGPRPGEVRNDITAALEPSGAVVNEVVAFPEEVDRYTLAAALGVDPATVETDMGYASMVRRLARAMVRGSDVYAENREEIASEFSGAAGVSDGVIVVREARPEDAAELSDDARIFQESLIDGFVEADVPVVGVRRSDGDPAATDLFIEWEISSVDNVEEIPGHVSLVFALRGRTGTFGTSETATALIPDLLGVPPLVVGTGTEMGEQEDFVDGELASGDEADAEADAETNTQGP